MNINPRQMIDILLAGAHEKVHQGEHDIAIGLFEQALSKLEALHGARSIKLTVALAELADSYDAVGRQLQARQCRSRLSEILRIHTGDDQEAAS